MAPQVQPNAWERGDGVSLVRRQSDLDGMYRAYDWDMSGSATELPVTEARHRFSDVVNAAAFRGEVTYVTRRGRRLAAVVPIEAAREYENTHRIGQGSGRAFLDFLDKHRADPEWSQDLAELRGLLVDQEFSWDDD
jgi:prevent-host-death family protein